MRVIIHARHNDNDVKEYFFSTDHCQATSPEGFIPTSFSLPMSVVPRPELPSGLITTVEELVRIFFRDGKEIQNPDPLFQPNYLG